MSYLPSFRTERSPYYVAIVPEDLQRLTRFHHPEIPAVASSAEIPRIWIVRTRLGATAVLKPNGTNDKMFNLTHSETGKLLQEADLKYDIVADIPMLQLKKVPIRWCGSA